jgi:hypothetical protein
MCGISRELFMWQYFLRLLVCASSSQTGDMAGDFDGCREGYRRPFSFTIQCKRGTTGRRRAPWQARGLRSMTEWTRAHFSVLEPPRLTRETFEGLDLESRFCAGRPSTEAWPTHITTSLWSTFRLDPRERVHQIRNVTTMLAAATLH